MNITHGLQDSSAATANLLYHLTALATLPRLHGGNQSTVVYIDCWNSFSATQLYKVTADCASRRSLDAGTRSASVPAATVARDALTHVHVLRCTSSRSLLTTISELPAYLLDSSAHKSSDRPLGLLVVHGINHFHWQDRFDAEIARLENVQAGGMPAPSATATLSTQVLAELKKLQETFECPIVCTVVPTTPPTVSTGTTTTPSLRNDETSPMPVPDNSAITDIYARNALFTLHPTRVRIAQFAPAMTLEECQRDKEKRNGVVKKAPYRLGVSAGGLSEIKDGPRTGREAMGFSMRITKDGTMSFE